MAKCINIQLADTVAVKHYENASDLTVSIYDRIHTIGTHIYFLGNSVTLKGVEVDENGNIISIESGAGDFAFTNANNITFLVIRTPIESGVGPSLYIDIDSLAKNPTIDTIALENVKITSPTLDALESKSLSDLVLEYCYSDYHYDLNRIIGSNIRTIANVSYKDINCTFSINEMTRYAVDAGLLEKIGDSTGIECNGTEFTLNGESIEDLTSEYDEEHSSDPWNDGGMTFYSVDIAIERVARPIGMGQTSGPFFRATITNKFNWDQKITQTYML